VLCVLGREDNNYVRIYIDSGVASGDPGFNNIEGDKNDEKAKCTCSHGVVVFYTANYKHEFRFHNTGERIEICGTERSVGERG
jgi:hypothetical protein